MKFYLFFSGSLCIFLHINEGVCETAIYKQKLAAKIIDKKAGVIVCRNHTGLGSS